MKKLLPILLCLLFGCNYQKDLENNELLPPEAFFAINNWSAQRAYPYGYVNDKKFLDERYNYFKVFFTTESQFCVDVGFLLFKFLYFLS